MVLQIGKSVIWTQPYSLTTVQVNRLVAPTAIEMNDQKHAMDRDNYRSDFSLPLWIQSALS